MTIPTKYPEWASTSLTQNTPDGSIDNKLEPTEEWKDSGSLYQENTPYPYLNYQFDLINQWIVNLDARAGGDIGDIYTTTINTPTASLDNKFGGTWTSRGTTASLGTIATAYVYERTA